MLISVLFDDQPIPELAVATEHGKLVLISRPATESKPKSRTLGTEPSFSSKKETSTYDNATIIHVFQGQYLQIRALVAHPTLEQFAVSGDSGLIQIWDSKTKEVINCRQFQPQSNDQGYSHSNGGEKNAVVDPLKFHIYSLAYSNSGKTLAVGFGNGVLRLLDANSLADLPQTLYGDQMGHNVSRHPIDRIVFSPDGSYCALAGIYMLTIRYGTYPFDSSKDIGKN
jgi:WD40 repeat protein